MTDARLDPEQVVALTRQEIESLAHKAGLPRYMRDTADAITALQRFASLLSSRESVRAAVVEECIQAVLRHKGGGIVDALRSLASVPAGMVCLSTAEIEGAVRDGLDPYCIDGGSKHIFEMAVESVCAALTAAQSPNTEKTTGRPNYGGSCADLHTNIRIGNVDIGNHRSRKP